MDLPHIAYVYVTINELKIPVQVFRQNPQTFLLKFRPSIAGDYLVTLKDFHGQLSLGTKKKPNFIFINFLYSFIVASPYIFPVYNPNGIHIEPVNPLQPINNCHFICT